MIIPWTVPHTAQGIYSFSIMKRKEVTVFSLCFLSLLCAYSLCNRCKGVQKESTTPSDIALNDSIHLYNVEVELNPESSLDNICLQNRIDSVYISFNDGRINALFINIEENIKPTISIPIYHNADGICPYRCYTLLFDNDGHLFAMGGLLFGQEGPDSDFCFEFGEWQYFDSNGKQRGMKAFD